VISKKKNSICVFGLGYVGLTLSLVLCEKKFNVYGIEKEKNKINDILNLKPDLYEPNLSNKIKKNLNNKRLKIYQKLNKKIIADTYIITVGTPLLKNNKCNFEMIKNVSYEIMKNLKDNDHIILRSTVKIGTTQKIVKKILDKSKKKYYLSFCPERTIEGNALNELKNLPQIISGNSKTALIKARKIFSKLTNKIVEVNSIESAEMIKLIDNMQRDVKFALSNEIALMCEQAKINVNDVIRLGKLNYPRTNLFDPGPVGGPCLEKDTFILSEFFSKKFKPRIGLSARKVNNLIIENAVNVLKKKINPNIKELSVAILGLAFKGDPPVADMRGSTSLKLIELLMKNFKNSKVSAYDELVQNKYFSDLKIKKHTKIIDAFNKTNIVIIHNNRKKFSKLNLKFYSKFMAKNSIIYDFWNSYDKKNLKLNNNTNYLSLGNLH